MKNLFMFACGFTTVTSLVLAARADKRSNAELLERLNEARLNESKKHEALLNAVESIDVSELVKKYTIV